MTCESSAELLETGWNSLTGQALSAQIRERMLVYLEQLQLWNKSYNLTAIREPGQMVVRHILDSLTLLPWIEGPLLDVGTGAGLPGIPLAIARPELDVTLIDSAGKKVRFLSHVQRSLSLANVHPIHGRVEEHVAQPYHCICSRAFSSLADFALACSHLMGPKTRLLAMKGRFPDQEIEQLPDAFTVESVEKLSVPGLQEDRHLVIMSVKP